jgi:hypothetical protein
MEHEMTDDDEFIERIKATQHRGDLVALGREHDKITGHDGRCRQYSQFVNGHRVSSCAILAAISERQRYFTLRQAEAIRTMSAVELLEYMVHGDGWAVVYYGDEFEYPAIVERLAQLKAASPQEMVPWPSDQPERYNACTDPCDMWTGPCACGAWHKDGR